MPVPLTVALNCIVVPMVAVAGSGATFTEVIVGLGGGVGVTLPPPPPQADISAISPAPNHTAAFRARVFILASQPNQIIGFWRAAFASGRPVGPEFLLGASGPARNIHLSPVVHNWECRFACYAEGFQGPQQTARGGCIPKE